MPSSTAWKLRGHCVGHDPDLWYPDTGDKRSAYRARTICNHCPVKQRCHQYAEDNEIAYGIWGGLRRNIHGAVSRHEGQKVGTRGRNT